MSDTKRLLFIKNKIDANNEVIEKCFTPNIFTLNNVVAELIEENRKLQQECTHEYENGYCIWCYKEENSDD